MLQSIQNNWTDISTILQEKNQLCRISSINLNLLTETVKILKFYEQSSKELEGENYPTLQLTFVCINFLKRMSEITDNDLNSVKTLKSNLLNSIESVLKPNLTKFHKIALFLFPPTNKLTQFSNLERIEIKDEVRKQLETFSNESNSHITESGEENEALNPDVQNLFSGFLQPSNTFNNESIIENELMLYENVNEILHNHFNLLQWWEFNKLKYPLLYRLSCKILATPASSSSSERIFSNARHLLSERRSLIGKTPETVDKIMFLHKNNLKKI